MASASPARAGEADAPACTENGFRVVEATLPNILMRELRRLPSEHAREAAAFLAAHPSLELRLGFGERAAAERWGRSFIEDPGAIARLSRSPRVLELAHALLHMTGGDEQSFVRSRADQRALAALAAAALVHEISHARDEEEVGWLTHLLESELVAFYRSHLFLADMFAGGADFDRLREVLELQRTASALIDAEDSGPGDRMERARRAAALLPRYRQVCTLTRRFSVKALNAAAESDDAFERLVLEPYRGKIPSISDDAAAALRDKRMQRKAYAEGLERLRRLGASPSPKDASTLTLFDEDLAFWQDPARVAQARRAFALRLTSLRAEMDRRRAAGALEPWKAPRAIVRYNLLPDLERLAASPAKASKPPSR